MEEAYWAVERMVVVGNCRKDVGELRMKRYTVDAKQNPSLVSVLVDLVRS